MSLKTIIKGVIGTNRINVIRGEMRILKEHHKNYIRLEQCFEDEIEYRIYSLKHKNLFNGYYDINPLHIGGQYILAQIVDRWANPLKDDSTIGMINLQTGDFTPVTTTKAWCWQQGSRIRWSGKNSDEFYYNDICNGKYCTVKYNFRNREKVTEYPYALYEIDKNEHYGLSLDFSRLQRLRPGYGYGRLKDETDGINAPDNSGIIKYDFELRKSSLLISLDELSKLTDDKQLSQHYINHISISPSGKRFMFFHIRTTPERPGWKVNLCVMNSDGTNLISFGESYSASHYTWFDDNKILVTGTDHNLILTYRIYDLERNENYIINKDKLMEDGHPTFLKDNLFVSDTYPNTNCIQKVFIHSVSKSSSRDLIRLYHDPRLVGEQRCDLHPKLCKINDVGYIFVDSTFLDCKRSIVMMKGKWECLENCIDVLKD